MTNYVQVINGQVASGPGPLPQSYTFADGSKTGNFDLLDAAIIKAEGFLPVVINRPVYDSRYQELAFDTYTIGADNVTENYKVVTYDLATVKANKIEEVIAKKYALIYSGITYNAKVYGTDASSMLNLTASATAAAIVGNTWSSDWLLADGTFVTITKADLDALATTINTRVVSIRAQAKAATDAILALTTQLDVVNYTISMS